MNEEIKEIVVQHIINKGLHIKDGHTGNNTFSGYRFMFNFSRWPLKIVISRLDESETHEFEITSLVMTAKRK